MSKGKAEKTNYEISFTFDFLREVVDEPSLLDKVTNGSVIKLTNTPSKRQNPSPKAAPYNQNKQSFKKDDQ